MPWQPNQHRLFCAKCNNGKGPAQMCKMCREGQVTSTRTNWKAEEKKR